MNAFSRDFRPALPQIIEAEQALLGAILVQNDAYWRVAGFLKPQHFAEKLHGTLYETMGRSQAARTTAHSPPGRGRTSIRKRWTSKLIPT